MKSTIKFLFWISEPRLMFPTLKENKLEKGNYRADKLFEASEKSQPSRTSWGVCVCVRARVCVCVCMHAHMCV